MADNISHLFTRQALDELSIRLINLESTLGDTNKPLIRKPQGKFIKVGKAVAGGVAYPDELDDPQPNTFYVELGTIDYPATVPGNTSVNFTAFTPDDPKLVHSLVGYVPQYSLVIVQRIFGQYYITQFFYPSCEWICANCEQFIQPDGGCSVINDNLCCVITVIGETEFSCRFPTDSSDTIKSVHTINAAGNREFLQDNSIGTKRTSITDTNNCGFLIFGNSINYNLAFPVWAKTTAVVYKSPYDGIWSVYDNPNFNAYDDPTNPGVPSVTGLGGCTGLILLDDDLLVGDGVITVNNGLDGCSDPPTCGGCIINPEDITDLSIEVDLSIYDQTGPATQFGPEEDCSWDIPMGTTFGGFANIVIALDGTFSGYCQVTFSTTALFTGTLPASCFGGSDLADNGGSATVTGGSIIFNGSSVAITSLSLEQQFVKDHKSWFSSCKCTMDLTKVLEKWTPETMTDARVTNVARTLHNKNPNVDIETIKKELWSYFG